MGMEGKGRGGSWHGGHEKCNSCIGCNNSTVKNDRLREAVIVMKEKGEKIGCLGDKEKEMLQ
jgi:hypothetical protein